MKKIIGLFLLAIFFSGFALAQDVPSEGWTPTWNVGDWWVVELEYNASAYNPIGKAIESDYQKVKVKHEIVGEENFNGESSYKFHIKPEKRTHIGPGEFIIYVSREKLTVIGMQEIDNGSVSKSYIISSVNSGPFTGGEEFSIYTLPGFPFLKETETKSYKIVYTNKKTEKIIERIRWQEISLANISEIPVADEIKNICGSSFLYKVKISNIIQIWSEKLNWFIYWDQDGIVGKLIDWKGKST